jgi:hypothetical protein
MQVFEDFRVDVETLLGTVFELAARLREKTNSPAEVVVLNSKTPNVKSIRFHSGGSSEE